METVVDDTLRAEASRYLLRFGCEHCAHFDPESGRCAEGFPNEPHRGVRLGERPAIVFCKSFELG
jgi:hypothetical protein